jgi:hypothetical protein
MANYDSYTGTANAVCLAELLRDAPPGVRQKEAKMKLSLITASVLAYTAIAVMLICEAGLLAIY